MFLALTAPSTGPLNEGPRRVVDRSIDRLVLLMSAEHEVQSESLQASFNQAIQSPISREIVYAKLIDRMTLAMAHQRPLVLFKCVQLLKGHIVRSPPSIDSLSQLN
ncbi:MAG: hypothetical protein Q8P67_02555 [archaeon]|nr:hypothetical protein [archaeon]